MQYYNNKKFAAHIRKDKANCSTYALIILFPLHL